eukprot:750501-Hanusia_phi.AAC.1
MEKVRGWRKGILFGLVAGSKRHLDEAGGSSSCVQWVQGDWKRRTWMCFPCQRGDFLPANVLLGRPRMFAALFPFLLCCSECLAFFPSFVPSAHG